MIYDVPTYETGCTAEAQWQKCAEELAEVLFEIRKSAPYASKFAMGAHTRPGWLDAAAKHRRERFAEECADVRVALANLERIYGLTPQEIVQAEQHVIEKLEDRGCI